jgi:hypothetical protein
VTISVVIEQGDRAAEAVTGFCLVRDADRVLVVRPCVCFPVALGAAVDDGYPPRPLSTPNGLTWCTHHQVGIAVIVEVTEPEVISEAVLVPLALRHAWA